MRPLFAIVVLMMLPLSFAAAQVVGGWKKADVKDPAVIEAADFAVKAQQAALKKAGKDETLALQKIVAAEQQVVSGMNRKLTLQVKSGDQIQSIETIVWTRAWLKSEERSQLSAWKVLETKE
ncbi:cystatin domain-containing protein [Anatilimnocola floriformis]|uniref:cystatin domain-containing protein n=1 Tax=Anatilimnocola floriformis TaxID=2948575 RepID=UPI0020C243AB|nr:cystatin domain-containing protein [Anatilimnocola floriformis]